MTILNDINFLVEGDLTLSMGKFDTIDTGSYTSLDMTTNPIFSSSMKAIGSFSNEAIAKLRSDEIDALTNTWMMFDYLIYTQRRRHHKKRIQKKWINRYGLRIEKRRERFKVSAAKSRGDQYVIELSASR